LREDEKRGLQGVLGVVLVVKNPQTDAVYHWPVPADQRPERRLVALAGEAPQQFPVRELASHFRFIQLVEKAKNGMFTECHWLDSPRVGSSHALHSSAHRTVDGGSFSEILMPVP
jgi:hypothetical protein